MKTPLRSLLIITLWLAAAGVAPAQSTAFTYQGRLNDGATPANGSYDLTFTLFDAISGPAQISGTLTNVATPVSNGLFTVLLDFGNQFPGADRWLAIEVTTNGGGSFTALTPRQRLTATPYAIHSLVADNAYNAATATTATNLIGSLAGDVTGPQSATVVSSVGGATAANVASGASAANAATSANTPNTIVKRDASGNFSAGDIAATSVSGNGAGLTNLNAWRLEGNAGTSAGVNFLGTTDNQPFEIKVNNVRGLRLEPNLAALPNLIGGAANNAVEADVVGAFIGGGDLHTILSGTFHSVIGGGYNNSIRSNASFSAIGGGKGNTIHSAATESVIAGGLNHTIESGAFRASIGGGDLNTIQAGAYNSVIAGGYFNTVGTNAFLSAIGGGVGNRIRSNATESVIAGGINHAILAGAYRSFIGGGDLHEIQPGAHNSTISGGFFNTIQTNAFYAVVGGGENNVILPNGTHAAIPGGRLNAATNQAFAAGTRAKARNTGAFVWADSQNADFTSTAANQFLIRAAGGVGINTNNPSGAALNVAGTVLATTVQSGSFSGGGAALTGLDASQLNSGTVPDARLSANVSLLGQSIESAEITDGTIVAADVNATSFNTAFWRTAGNAGTTAGAHFLGTTDNQPLEIKVNGLRALRMELNGSGAPNLIGGSPRNFAGAGVEGATIAGGGATSYGGVAYTNSVLSDFGVVGGGLRNNIAANSFSATIAGGFFNDIGTNSGVSAIGGGQNNNIAANSAYATIAGGVGNNIAANSLYGTIAGGYLNDIGTNSDYSAIGGGYDNNIAANSFSATIAGGFFNDIGTNSLYSAISGGQNNNIAANSAYATIAGGVGNNIGTNSDSSAIGGGNNNNIAANSFYATIAGGYLNDIGTNSDYSAIGGGDNNNIAANSQYATIPGGHLNFATNYAFAAGRRAKANHQGAFVWGDSTFADIASTANNQFLIRAAGGVGIGTNNPAGAALAVVGGIRAGVNGTLQSRVQFGTATVGTGTNGVNTFTITFPTAFSTTPKVFVTAKGNDTVDTFVISTRNVLAANFKVNIIRVDAAVGWGQSLQVDWYAVE